MEFFDSVKKRRTYYGIGNSIPVSDEKLEQIVRDSVKYAPSAFNSQGERAMLLLGAQHGKLWDITLETLRRIVPADAFPKTEEKILSFRKGYGTVLFFEDTATVQDLQEKFSLYKDNFPVWSLESNGMLQYILWTALENEGIGASLQHYNPLIDEEVRRQWGIPASWRLLAQMPFGSITAPAGEKEFKALEERIRIFK